MRSLSGYLGNIRFCSRTHLRSFSLVYNYRIHEHRSEYRTRTTRTEFSATFCGSAAHQLVCQGRVVHLYHIGWSRLVSNVRFVFQFMACRVGSFLSYVMALLFWADCDWSGHCCGKVAEHQHGRALECSTMALCGSLELFFVCRSAVDFVGFDEERSIGEWIENLLVEFPHQ